MLINVEPAQARRRAQRAALVRIRVSIEHVHAEHKHEGIRSVTRKGTRPVENLSPPPQFSSCLIRQLPNKEGDPGPPHLTVRIRYVRLSKHNKFRVHPHEALCNSKREKGWADHMTQQLQR